MPIPPFTKQVPFADTDMAGVVHFSRILCYVEEAEHAALSALGVPPVSKSGGFPKVRVECDYRSPLRFGDAFSVQMKLLKVGEKSLNWTFSISCQDRLIAEGGVVTVYVSTTGQPQLISEETREKFAGA